MNLVLFDSSARETLLPLTFARPIADLRLGTLTIAEKWERQLEASVSVLTQDYLAAFFPTRLEGYNLLINAAVLPTPGFLSLVKALQPGEAYHLAGELIAANFTAAMVADFAREQGLAIPPSHSSSTREEVKKLELPDLPLLRVEHPSDLFVQNDRASREDFALLTAGRTSQPPSETNTIIGPADQLFIEEGVTLEACTINCTSGPVYFGKGAVILEGCLLRGPLSVGEGSLIKMGTKIYGATTLGPYCKAGGEINNVIFQANSNKGHEGYLGNAVIGKWCNIGADTNASNLKNDYSKVKTWSYAKRGMRQTELQFHGLIMGDHCKVGINTMFNTGTVVGFSSNIFGAGFPPPFLPSFTWGGGEGRREYRLDRAMATAERVMARRNRPFSDDHRRLFEHIFAADARYRSF